MALLDLHLPGISGIELLEKLKERQPELVDWANRVQALVDHPRYAQAERITLACDNLSTHTLAALYQAFGPAAALRLAQKLELVHTPKHGSWLNVVSPNSAS